MSTITIELTRKEADLLSRVLGSHEDSGPYGEGWQSPELEALCAVVDAQIQRQKQQ